MAAVALVAVAIILAVAFFLANHQVATRGSAELYTIDVPTVVVQEQIEANTDGMIDVIVVRCLRTNDPVLFETFVTWVSEEGPTKQGAASIFQQRNASGGAGCEGSNAPPIESSIALPEGGLPPGTWRFVSTVNVLDAETGELLDTELNTSETFEVV